MHMLQKGVGFNCMVVTVIFIFLPIPPHTMDTPEHVWGKPTKVNLLNLITNTDLLEKPMLLSVQMQGNDNVRNIVPAKKCKVLLLFYCRIHKI